MKILLALICIVFYATCITSHEIRVKRGLSADEQKKLVDALNKDRQEVGSRTGLKMKQIVYDTSLESEVKIGPSCYDTRAAPLRWNKDWQEIFDYHENPHGQTWRFFVPNRTSIACSKTFHCSQTLTKEDDRKFVGKTVEYVGLCVLEGKDPADVPVEIRKYRFPPVAKYADILGVPMPGEKQGSGRVFNFMIFLLLVIHI